MKGFGSASKESRYGRWYWLSAHQEPNTTTSVKGCRTADQRAFSLAFTFTLARLSR